jgi:hypothetical protein
MHYPPRSRRNVLFGAFLAPQMHIVVSYSKHFYYGTQHRTMPSPPSAQPIRIRRTTGHIGKMADPGKIAEDRRKFYVSLTRARDEVRIFCSGFVVTKWGRRKGAGPSRFLAEVGLVDIHEPSSPLGWLILGRACRAADAERSSRLRLAGPRLLEPLDVRLLSVIHSRAGSKNQTHTQLPPSGRLLSVTPVLCVRRRCGQ